VSTFFLSLQLIFTFVLWHYSYQHVGVEGEIQGYRESRHSGHDKDSANGRIMCFKKLP